MTIVTFAQATRLGSHIIVTAYGVSGCGKTLSLLLLGRGLAGPNGKLGMIDTETGRGRIYASRVPGGYLYAELTPPFTPQRYVQAIDDAEASGIEVLVIDQASAEWDGIGGILEMAEAGEARSGKSLEGLVKWAAPKAAHKRYVQRLINSHMHLLISLRAKEKMKQYTAKDVPLPAGVRVGDIISEGFTPIQDKRFIFETTVQLFLPLGPRADLGKPIVEKCPEDLWSAFPEGEQISVKTGELIREWVAGGEPVDKELLTLRRQAEEAAGLGIEGFRAYWRALAKHFQSQLTDQLDNLRSIAESADTEKGAPPSHSEDGQPAPPQMGQELSGDSILTSAQSEDNSFVAMREALRFNSGARDSLNAAWAEMQPAREELLRAGRGDLADEIDALYDQLLRPLPIPPGNKWVPGDAEHVTYPQEPELASPPSVPTAAARTCAEHGVIDCARCRPPAAAPGDDLLAHAMKRRPDKPDWSHWRQRFDHEMRLCQTKDALTTLIAARFDAIADYNHALPRAAGIFAEERARRMEELPDRFTSRPNMAEQAGSP